MYLNGSDEACDRYRGCAPDLICTDRSATLMRATPMAPVEKIMAGQFDKFQITTKPSDPQNIQQIYSVDVVRCS